MQFDEWSQEQFGEWDDMGLPEGPAAPDFGTGPSPPGAFPEVEIGSSSDDDAPPVPQSTQLARENLHLRARVSALVTQQKTLEQTNDTLRRQLGRCRHTFASGIKALFK
jgi:hypothetical protein